MRKLIIGCGYLGRRVAARWLSAGHEVAGVVRRGEQTGPLTAAGIQPIVADVTRPETLAALPMAETVLFAVGFDGAGGKSRRAVFVDGLRAVLDAIGPQTGRVIFISSTGVYGPALGQWVDEDSPCRPRREAGRVLLEAEQLFLAHPLGRRGIVLRLAGLYGPGRLPRIDALEAAAPLAIAAREPVNLIHVEDAAAAMLAAEARAEPPRTYNVADGHPVERREYLRRLAEVLRLPPPTFCDAPPEAAARGGDDKRVSNVRLCSELGVEFAYPSYWEGLAGSVAEEEEEREAEEEGEH
jgi:nucleoside-diphosphate-sugar epimerase